MSFAIEKRLPQRCCLFERHASDLGASSTEAATLCDQLTPPDCPCKVIGLLPLIVPLETVQLPCCLHTTISIL